jgi:DNA helicase IV
MAIDLRQQQLDADTAKLAETRGQIKSGYAGGTKVASKFDNYVKDYIKNTGDKSAMVDPKKRKELELQQQEDLRLYRDTKDLESSISQTKGTIKAEQGLLSDAQAAGQNVDKLGLDLSLDRLRDDSAVQESRDAYKAATDLSLVRDSATAGLQAAESSSNRQLAARLASAGVKGGAAGGAFTDLASMNLRNRSALESNLAQQNVQSNMQRAQFETQLAQFDLGQGTAEKNMRNQVIGGLTNYSQLQRSGMKQDEIAKNMGTMSGGGK